ncbi:MAG: hypothetical protein KAV42_10295 [Candidatus Krumholzibacteria bacterium]|nr:hypothetical protein [Candidatus Krumholzibacteria bacterium]
MRIPRNLPFLLKVYFIAGTVIFVAGAILHNNSLLKRMKEQSESTTQLFSRFVGITLEEAEDQVRQDFFREIQTAIDLPYILTDTEGRPLIWNGIGIEMGGDEDYTRGIDFDPEHPDDPVLESVYRMSKEFDRINRPVVVEGTGYSLIIHYGHSRLTRELAYAPYIQFAVLVIFLLFGFLGFRTMKQGEQRSIWVGMAKETAHQLGTPLSSIMGWLAIIREQADKAGAPESLSSAVIEAQADVDRLSRISSRFGKIGSAPDLEYQEMVAIIRETVDYFERRRPSLKIESTIDLDAEELPLVRCSTDLLGWVFENLIKNSLDAIAGREGKIHIKAVMNTSENHIEIRFSDNGKGMTAGLRRRAFDPGITTKKRGWGLGLALVKRIVEEIHGGSIRIIHTQPDRGTEFLMTFPVD